MAISSCVAKLSAVAPTRTYGCKLRSVSTCNMAGGRCTRCRLGVRVTEICMRHENDVHSLIPADMDPERTRLGILLTNHQVALFDSKRLQRLHRSPGEGSP